MTVQHDPMVQRYRLRQILRRARKALHATQKDVAEAMEWSTSKLVRIEHGDVRISMQDLRALLRYYGITDPAQIKNAEELARAGRGRSGYAEYADRLGANFREYLAWEASASNIRAYHPTLILGLLQREHYAHALLERFGVNRDNADVLWDVRSQRQDLHYRDKPPCMTFFLDESALHRQVGGATVMLQQLRRVLELAEQPHVTIRLLPFSLGAYPGMLESFAVLEFAGADLSDVVHLETSEQATFRADEEPERARKFIDLSQQLEAIALGSQDSINAIKDAIAEITGNDAGRSDEQNRS